MTGVLIWRGNDIAFTTQETSISGNRAADGSIGRTMGVAARGYVAPPGRAIMASSQTRGRSVKNSALGFGMLLPLAALSAQTQTQAGAAAARTAPAGSEWRLIGLNAEQQHFSPLRDISDKNVARLGLAWAVELPARDGLVGVPLVADDVIYESGAMSRVYANDVRDGHLLWTYDPKVKAPPGQIVATWGGHVNRGLALWEDLLFVGTGDCRLVAIDRRKGAPVWEARACDPARSYTITGAPRIGDGKVFIGNANADTGVNRGYVVAYDARTGRELWRFYTIPGDPSKGFENEAMARASKTWGKEYWKHSGGGAVWDAITYDTVLKQVYIGTDGASPINPNSRGEGGGDELYTTSIIALDAATGSYKWHLQTTPHDGWNYDATMHIMLAELDVRGSRRRVVMEAPKNGYFYVLDAKTGELLTVNNFVPINWSSAIDPKSGRPTVRREAEWWNLPRNVTATILPSGGSGAHSWQPMSFSPRTGLVYIPTMEQPMALSVSRGDEAMAPGAYFNNYVGYGDPKIFKGGLVAYDPVRAKVVWRRDVGPPQNGGVLATAGNLVFQGTSAGSLRAYRAGDGRPLWEFKADTGFYAAPITVKIDGKQLLIVPSGSGTSSSVFTYARVGGITHGPSRLLAFSLDGSARLPPAAPYQAGLPQPPVPRPAPSLVARGRDVFYGAGCDLCHGLDAIGAQGASEPDLRRSSAVLSADLAAIVIGGARADKGMPSFAGTVTADQLPALRAYIVEQAWKAYLHESIQ
jgi:quinohemoprotein ethanol dehydrogenase